MVQGFLSMSDAPDESTEAAGWISRLDEAARRL